MGWEGMGKHGCRRDGKECRREGNPDNRPAAADVPPEFCFFPRKGEMGLIFLGVGWVSVHAMPCDAMRCDAMQLRRVKQGACMSFHLTSVPTKSHQPLLPPSSPFPPPLKPLKKGKTV